MKNKLIDLNNALFEQLERLNDEDTKGQKLEVEINRSKAVSGIAREIINNGKLALAAQIALAERQIDKIPTALSLEEPRGPLTIPVEIGSKD